VREAVLVAKHGCGFVTWPSRATMPDGSTYNYSVASSAWRGGKGDVLSDFKASCLAKGIGVGYYYSLGSNGYTKGLNLTAAQLEVIEMQQMTELWSGEYGNNGNLTEIWFDGGIEGKSRPAITAMLKKMQPKAAAFNGCVVQGGAKQSKSTCITPNALRWIGTEAVSENCTELENCTGLRRPIVPGRRP
jgi:alpha-L-fucosidase